MLQAIESVLHFMPGGMDPIEVMVSDYVSCFELQEQPDPKVLRDAIVLAIEYGEWRYIYSIQGNLPIWEAWGCGCPTPHPIPSSCMSELFLDSWIWCVLNLGINYYSIFYDGNVAAKC